MGLKLKCDIDSVIIRADDAHKGCIYEVLSSVNDYEIGSLVMRTYHAPHGTYFVDLKTGDTWSTLPGTWRLKKVKSGTSFIVQ